MMNGIFTPSDFVERLICDQEAIEENVLIGALIDEINDTLKECTYVEKDRTTNTDGSMTIRYEYNFKLSLNVYNSVIIEKVLAEFRREGWRCDKSGSSYCFQIHVCEKSNNIPPANRYSFLKV